MYDKDGKRVWNLKKVYKIIKDYFKCNLSEESIESLLPFAGQQKDLNKPFTTKEVRQATLKLNNRAAGPDRI